MFLATRHSLGERAPPNPSQKSSYSINLPGRDGRLSRTRCLVIYGDGLPAQRRYPFQVVIGPNIRQLYVVQDQHAIAKPGHQFEADRISFSFLFSAPKTRFLFFGLLFFGRKR